MRAPFEFIDHTADYAMRAWGPDFPALVQHAAVGFSHLLADIAGLVPTEHHEVSVTGTSREEVLIHALKGLLRLREDGYLPVSVQVLSADDCTACLTVGTTALEAVAARVLAAVKAVTYHAVQIVAADGGLSVEVVFDA